MFIIYIHYDNVRFSSLCGGGSEVALESVVQQ